MNERIRKLRKSQGMTQEEFANILGLSRNFISQVESGAKKPSNRTKNDICREFSVSEEWLETGNGDMYIIPIEEEALIISELIEKDSPVYDLVKSIIKIYKDLDVKSQEVLERFCVDLAGELSSHKK